MSRYHRSERDIMRNENNCPECGRDNTAETGVATLKRYNEEEDRTYLCCKECGRAIGWTPGDTRWLAFLRSTYGGRHTTAKSAGGVATWPKP